MRPPNAAWNEKEKIIKKPINEKAHTGVGPMCGTAEVSPISSFRLKYRSLGFH